MNIISYAGAIGGRIVVSEYVYAFKLAYGNLCYVRKEVVRDSFRILAHFSALVCADWIKVTQKRD